MSHNPLVSAVIIFLNEERFLEEAIASVFAQSYPHWELLLVDDGSTDKSSALAQRYARQYPDKVRYLEHIAHQNRGMSASRNLGVCNAAGEYIAFLDGDDVWLPQKLEEQVAILQSQPEVDMVYGPLQRWYSWNNNPADVANEDLYGFGKDGRHPYADSVVEPPKLLALFLEDEYFIPGGILIRSETLRRSGGYEASFRGMYEDAVALVKICLTARIYVSSTSWYKYRMHPRSCTHVAWLRREDHSAEQRYLKWVRRYLHQQKVADLEVWRAWRKTYWRCCLASFYRLLAACRHPIAYSKELLKRKDGKFALISSVLLVSSACRGAIHFSSLI